MIKLPYTITGTVEHGKGLGTTIDFPTANIVPREDIAGLDFGVYASSVEIDGVFYKAITNLGVKPTVKNDTAVNAESFIKDYSGDLYGKEIEVTLEKFIRGERKFSSVKELSEQISRDVKTAFS